MNLIVSVNQRPPSVTLYIEGREPLVIYDFPTLMKLTCDLCDALRLFNNHEREG